MSNRLPAEWEAQDAVLLTWPHKDSDWNEQLDTISTLYHDLAITISQYTQVIIGAPNHQLNTLKQTFAGHNISVHPVESDDTWARDHGPISIYNNSTPQLLDFTFNGWGNKFACKRDNTINQQLAQQQAFNNTALIQQHLVLEGGAIESDGNGCLLTTSQCLLNPNRNPGLSKTDIEKALCQALGTHTIHWLSHGYLAGDDTDSHIDTLARFCPNDTIAYVHCDDPQDEHYDALQAMHQELGELRTPQGKPYTLIPLPWPKAIYDSHQQRLPATYANFLVSNQAVFAPIYLDDNDTLALEQLQTAFKGYDIIPVNCLPLILQHGSLHCITMQLPRGVLSQ